MRDQMAGWALKNGLVRGISGLDACELRGMFAVLVQQDDQAFHGRRVAERPAEHVHHLAGRHRAELEHPI